MSKSYTPGLKVLRNTTIRKERKLPLKGDINCSKGDSVKYNDVVASTYLPGNIHMINISNQLNIEPETINDYLVASINQEVDKGDIIAENKGLFGFFKSQISSPFKGKISNISKRRLFKISKLSRSVKYIFNFTILLIEEPESINIFSKFLNA